MAIQLAQVLLATLLVLVTVGALLLGVLSLRGNKVLRRWVPQPLRVRATIPVARIQTGPASPAQIASRAPPGEPPIQRLSGPRVRQ